MKRRRISREFSKCILLFCIGIEDPALIKTFWVVLRKIFGSNIAEVAICWNDRSLSYFTADPLPVRVVRGGGGARNFVESKVSDRQYRQYRMANIIDIANIANFRRKASKRIQTRESTSYFAVISKMYSIILNIHQRLAGSWPIMLINVNKRLIKETVMGLLKSMNAYTY